MSKIIWDVKEQLFSFFSKVSASIHILLKKNGASWQCICVWTEHKICETMGGYTAVFILAQMIRLRRPTRLSNSDFVVSLEVIPPSTANGFNICQFLNSLVHLSTSFSPTELRFSNPIRGISGRTTRWKSEKRSWWYSWYDHRRPAKATLIVDESRSPSSLAIASS